MSVLSVRSLSKRYGTTHALVDFNLDIEAGSRTAVVGPSGSGKTTLLRLIAGFETPDNGHIALDGQTIATPAASLPAHRRNIGLVMQEGALFPHLTVLDNIRFGIRGEPNSEARALGLLDLVELTREMADRFPHQLSGGQQQRVALARALARRPKLMLLDEPFSALDTALREQMRDATARVLAEADVATILVTHDQDEAMNFADQLVVLRDGRLVQAGRPRDVYGAPVDFATAQFLGPSIILDGEVRGGLAHCDLGVLALREDQRQPEGTARFMLRPEQLSLMPTASAASPSWNVETIRQAGSFVRIKLTGSNGQNGSARLALVTMARDLPPVGSAVAIIVLGAAHRLR
jgi:iron(III) transport system ATP-binding protein